jgi:hypothetical protein
VIEIIKRQLVIHKYDYVIKKTRGYVQLYVTKNKKLVVIITVIPHKKTIPQIHI